MEDFTKPKTEAAVVNITFRIDNDIFEAYAMIGAELMSSTMNAENLVKVAGLQHLTEEMMTTEQRIDALSASQAETLRVYNFLDQVLLPASAARFAERRRMSGPESIDLPQVFEVYRFLVSKYGNRPTQPSLPSKNGHDGTGMSSMVGAPRDPWTPPAYPQPGIST